MFLYGNAEETLIGMQNQFESNSIKVIITGTESIKFYQEISKICI